MFRFPFFLVLGILLGPASRADETLTHARAAGAVLGPAIWSTVIEIENTAARSRYPARLHALVFEVSGVLWFYTSLDGTQSFSLHRGRLAEEKADFGPLLRDIEPGFTRWSIVERDSDILPEAEAIPLRNGCFVESVAAWQTRVVRGEILTAPQLLSYFVDTPGGRMGHTVLTYLTAEGVEVIDSTTGRVSDFPAAYRADAVRLAQALRGRDVARARWLPLELTGELRETTRLAGGAAADEDAAAPQSTLRVG